MTRKLKRFIGINIGLLTMSVGLYFFLIPSQMAVGGVTGLAMVIKHYIPSVNLGIIMGGFNVILLILAFILIGVEFFGYTIYCSLALSGIIGGLEYIFPMTGYVAEDLMLNLIYGIIIQGIGMAMIFHQNASTGGTDIIAKILNKYFKIDIGKALFLSDALIVILAGITFGKVLGLYALLGILINGLVIDKMIEQVNQKFHILIISEEYVTISEYIQNELNRGNTQICGKGGYTLLEKQILSVVLNRREYIKLKQAVIKIDPEAFLTASSTHEVIGRGFSYNLTSA